MSERTQQVKINYHSSKPMPIIYGVTQGRVLGPILFMIFIKEVCNMEIDVKTVSYADIQFYSARSKTEIRYGRS